MKLILKLANFTAEYQLSGVPVMQYIDGNMYVIESTASEPTRVQEKPNVPVVNVPNAPAKPAKAVSTTVKQAEYASNAKSCDINPFIKELRECIATPDIEKIRALLGKQFSDTDMNNLIAALESSFTGGCVRHTVRIRDILIFSMFLIAGFGPSKTRDMLQSIGVITFMPIRVMSSIAYPSASDMAVYQRLNSLIKPYVKYACTRKKNGELIELHFNDIVDAMQAGYSDAALIRKYGRCIESIAGPIRNGMHHLCNTRTDIKYPIKKPTSKVFSAVLKYCSKCECLIPVSRLVDTNGEADTCTKCQKKLEKAAPTKSN